MIVGWAVGVATIMGLILLAALVGEIGNVHKVLCLIHATLAGHLVADVNRLHKDNAELRFAHATVLEANEELKKHIVKLTKGRMS